MTSGSLPQCRTCRHFRSPLDTGLPVDGSCAAFPAVPGIPAAISANQFDHRRPYPGDNGVRWEAREGVTYRGRSHQRTNPNHHSNFQLRDPNTGEWVDAGPLSHSRIQEIFGERYSFSSVPHDHDTYRVTSHDRGRVVLSVAEGKDVDVEAESYRVPRHFSPDSARKFAGQVDSMMEHASDYESDSETDEELDLTDYTNDTRDDPLSDGTYVRNNPELINSIELVIRGDENDVHSFDASQAEWLRDALREEADNTETAVETREENERDAAEEVENERLWQESQADDDEDEDEEDEDEEEEDEEEDEEDEDEDEDEDDETRAQRERDEAEELEREEREEAEERAREAREGAEEQAREELERAANWWDDEPFMRLGKNNLLMSGPEQVQVESNAHGVQQWTTVDSAEEFVALSAAIRRLLPEADEMASKWTVEYDEDDDEIEPDFASDKIRVSDRLSLTLLEDGNMVLETTEQLRGDRLSVWDIPLWHESARPVADNLDRLLERIKVAPKLPAESGVRSHQRTEPWEGQPRVPPGVGGHGGEWTDKGKVVGTNGREGYTLDRLRGIYGNVVLDVPFADESYATLYAGGQIVVGSDLYPGLTTAVPPLGRTVDRDDVGADDIPALAEQFEWAAGLIDEFEATGEDPEPGLADWVTTDSNVLIGFDQVEGVVVGWPKVDEPSTDDLDASYDLSYYGSGDARDFADALREVAGFEPDIVDEIDAGSGYDLVLWSDHDVQFNTKDGDPVLTMWQRESEAVFDHLWKLREAGAGIQGAPETVRPMWLGTAMQEIRSHSDGSVTIGRPGSPLITIAADDLDKVIDAFDDLLNVVRDDVEFTNEDSYAPPQTEVLETVGARARRIFRALLFRKYGGPGGDHWMDQFRRPKGEDGGQFAESPLSAAVKLAKAVGKGFPFGRAPVKVRPGYARLKTTANVEARLQLDLRTVLRQKAGKNATVRLGSMNVTSARETAEGIMRIAERWPETRLDAIKLGDLEGKTFGDIAVAAKSRRVTITLDEGLATSRKRSRARLVRGMHAGRPGDDYAYVGASLFGAAVDAMTGGAQPNRDHATNGVKEHLAEKGLLDADVDRIQAEVKAQLGDVALHSRANAVSEALADDALHGEGASPLSKRIRSHVTRSYVEMLEGGRLVDYRRPGEVKVPKGPPLLRPPGPMEKPNTGRVLTPMERLQEMYAAGHINAAQVREILEPRIKMPPADEAQVAKLAARIMRDAKKAKTELAPDEATARARELLTARDSRAVDVRSTAAFARALALSGEISALAIKGDSLQLLKWVQRQNTSALYGVATLHDIRISEDTKLKPTHDNLVAAVVKAALADADRYASSPRIYDANYVPKPKKPRKKRGAAGDSDDDVDLSWLEDAYLDWLAAIGDVDLDDDTGVPATAARSLLLAFGR